MKLCTAQLLWSAFLILSLVPMTRADLESDKRALLAFVAPVGTTRGGPNLNWTNATNLCTSWVGITCSPNGTRVERVQLAGAGLTGSIPSDTLGRLDQLRALNLASNHLNGTLPSDLFFLPFLRNLSVQHNQFTGNIPVAIQNLTRLTELYIQYNFLSGPIPEITSTELKHLNVSYNRLNGSIPSSLEAFPNSSFLGNPLLCGPPLESCALHHPPPDRDSSIIFIVIMILLFGLASCRADGAT